MIFLHFLAVLALCGAVSAAELEDTVKVLTRQLMLQSLSAEERVRSDGHSGLKQTRLRTQGTRPYHSESHTGHNVAAIHDHANNIRTVGMGEFIAVLNGVEFRTRHNDYSLKMPSKTSSKYHATEPIPFPEVPPAVKQVIGVDKQIAEMREWFKAWRDQDTSVRDYRPYFKPVLCYLEGAWTTNTKTLEEPFESDRHFVDATSWFDLQDKVRLTSYSGSKNILENFSYLPTTVINILNGTVPVLAQWNYRILCHPLQEDLPLNRLRVIDELLPRMANRKTFEEHLQSRAARFQINPSDKDKWIEGRTKYGLLDELMAQIPGKDNYIGEMKDEAFGTVAYQYNMKNKKLNTARYNRWYATYSTDAMGTNKHHRAFADETVFMAMTSQPQVASMKINVCNRKGKECQQLEQKWTYAVPLEIIYMTPLSSWNPYDLEYKSGSSESEVTAGKRNGGFTASTAYDGIRHKLFYQTPSAFYSGEEVNRDTADTTKGTVGVLDRSGTVKKVRASGTRIMLPEIVGIGKLRQRFPIMPVHGEGGGVWKELEALKDIVLWPAKFAHMYRQAAPTCQDCGGQNNETSTPVTPIKLKTGLSQGTTQSAVRHYHVVFLDAHQVGELKQGKAVKVDTEVANGHTHTLVIRYRKRRYIMARCDGTKSCKDGHPRVLLIDDN